MLMTTQQKQTGVTLIESMIALLVISIGLLGIAALQINSVQQNSSALWHSQAVLNAYDMADRIRSNESAINDYIGIDTDTGYNKDCTSTSCSTSDLITADATDWSKALSALPSGRGLIRATDGIDGQLDVVVMWDDEGTGATGTACGANPNVDLTCYTITMGILP